MSSFDEFMQGWWTCFLSFAETNEFYADANDMPVMEVLKGAQISVEECNAVLEDKSSDINEKIRYYLEMYINWKKKHG